jgi:glycosyltransferase involved in cell wall biosynthesis
MRILMITDFYWPFVGGVEQHVRRLSHALAARGHQVAVATLGNDRLPRFEHDGPVRVHRLRSTTQRAAWLYKNHQRAWAPPFGDPEVTRGLMGVVSQERPEIVHGHDWLARSFLPLKASSRARFVMSLHYYTLSCAKKSLMMNHAPCAGPGLARCLRCAAEHYGLAKGVTVALANWTMSAVERAAADMFLPVSQATAEGNGLSERDPYQVIPNFMPESPVVPAAVEAYTVQLPDRPFLLFVGDLRPDKGINVLLAAYSALVDAPPLVLIGKVWAESPREFPPNVIVFKNWPNDAVLAAWERSLMAIVPSVWPEPFGLVVIEAMAAGRPVLASRIGGIPDIVVDGETGLLLPPGDPDALRQAIERLLADPDLREEMGRAAQTRAAMYQAAAVVPRIEQVYTTLLNTPSEAYDATLACEHHY